MTEKSYRMIRLFVTILTCQVYKQKPLSQVTCLVLRLKYNLETGKEPTKIIVD